MTHHELGQIVADLVTQLSMPGFENPPSFDPDVKIAWAHFHPWW
jgi:hypothetical protein